MPSLLSGLVGEPVHLTASDASPVEPPHRPSQEKQSRQPSSPVGKLMNGFAIDGSAGAKHIVDGVFLSGPNGVNPSLHSLPNGRNSGSTDSRERAPSRSGSSHSMRSGSGGFVEAGGQSPGPINGFVKHRALDHALPRPQTKGNTAPDPGSKLAETGKLGNSLHSGHVRAHSASAPPIHNTTLNGINQQQTAVGLNAEQTPSTQKDLVATNRYSSPSAQPNSNPAYGSSSSTSLHVRAPNLQHRHTLQVPRLSTSRTSRDFTSPTIAPDDAFIDSERLSPTYAGGRASTNLVRRNTRSIHSDLYLDDVPPDGDMARWTETIRQKRSSRRKKKEEEEDDRVMVGTKVDMNHVNWVTAYNMLTGIRFTVSRTNAKMNRELTDADFDARHKFSFDITGNELTPSAKYDFKFKDYAPWVFRHLRAKFHLDPADYLMSLTSKYILSELGSPGKSGSFFYFSRDYKYIIKTIHHAEHKLLRKILREYYAHIERNPNTLLSQFYGLHRVKMPYGRKVHFVIMNNLFPPHRDIHQTFDLKGSTIGRDFKEEDLERNPRATLKDLNWLRRDYRFEFGPDKKFIFVEQIKRDVILLQKLKIMDYSLLVGIHDMSKGNEENLRDKTLQVFQPGGEGNEEPEASMLMRTPSKLENARKARQLRQIIKTQKPVPMDKSTSKMPDELLEERKDFIFYSDDGGFRASHKDGQPGDKIYYLGIIDCLTHYGFIKRAEHFWKGMSNNKSQISPIPPEDYGERFVKFITGLTMTAEEAEREKQSGEHLDGAHRQTSFGLSRKSTDKVVQNAEKQAHKTEQQGASEEATPDKTITSMRSTSAEIQGGVGGQTLPVVKEDGEAGSRDHSPNNQKDELPGERWDSPPLPDCVPPPPPSKDPRSRHKQLPSIHPLPRLSMTGSSTVTTSEDR